MSGVSDVAVFYLQKWNVAKKNVASGEKEKEKKQQSDIDRKFRKISHALGSVGLPTGMLWAQICQAATAGPFGQCP